MCGYLLSICHDVCVLAVNLSRRVRPRCQYVTMCASLLSICHDVCIIAVNLSRCAYPCCRSVTTTVKKEKGEEMAVAFGCSSSVNRAIYQTLPIFTSSPAQGEWVSVCCCFDVAFYDQVLSFQSFLSSSFSENAVFPISATGHV